MSGRKHREKGDRFELSLVKILLEAGIVARRTPLSGATSGTLGGFDISAEVDGRNFRIEAKHHRIGFARLYRWLDPVDLLVVKTDHAEPLAIMTLSKAIELLRASDTEQKS
jgi:Holliday junction resolvase